MTFRSKTTEAVSGLIRRLLLAGGMGFTISPAGTYHDVRMNWFVASRPAPIAQYRQLIADYERLDERTRDYSEAMVDELFTEEEAATLEREVVERNARLLARASGDVARRSASGVRGGSRPSGGSTIRDVRLVPTTVVPWSSQKLL